jgi:hypothetical protein
MTLLQFQSIIDHTHLLKSKEAFLMNKGYKRTKKYYSIAGRQTDINHSEELPTGI